nr:hypothetical protein [Campylobacter sp. LR264d]
MCDKPRLISDENTLKLQTPSELSPQDKAINLMLNSGKTLDKKLTKIIANKLYE